MMKKLTLLMAAFVVLAGTTANAQGFDFGVKAGLNVSHVWGEDTEDCSAKAGFNAGVFADYGFTRALYLGAGLEYQLKGFKMKDEDVTFNLSYIQLPVYGKFKFNVTDNFRVYCQFGPYFAFGIGGKAKQSVSEDGLTFTVKAKNFGDHGWARRFDCGLGFGAGVEFGRWMAGIAYDLGLTSLDREDDGKIYNGNFSINVGYKF